MQCTENGNNSRNGQGSAAFPIEKIEIKSTALEGTCQRKRAGDHHIIKGVLEISLPCSFMRIQCGKRILKPISIASDLEKEVVQILYEIFGVNVSTQIRIMFDREVCVWWAVAYKRSAQKISAHGISDILVLIVKLKFLKYIQDESNLILEVNSK